MFKLISLFSLRTLPSNDNEVYLTFDDGPEPGITEFVLNILKGYNAKATFFCTGENYEKYPELVKLIKDEGHTIGNHTYSHLNGYKIDDKIYTDDVIKAKEIIRSNIFRPPWGALTLKEFVKLIRNNNIVMWSISSCDFNPNTDWNKHCDKMVKKTKPGSIILFHFNLKHADGTKIILPKYLDSVFKLGYGFNPIIIR